MTLKPRALASFNAFTAKLEGWGESNQTLGWILLFVILGSWGVQRQTLINPDVAFLAWISREVLGPPVFGVDIWEINPPLAFMLYTPAALLSSFMGFGLAIKIWITLLGCLSVIGVWLAADRPLRAGVAGMLALFFVCGMPGGYGQREQIALLLCAPYAAGSLRDWRLALMSGVMAGVGFCIKPHYLIALLLVFATRRRLRLEEWAIAVTGLAYAASILLFFQPYLFGFLPMAVPSYAAVFNGREDLAWLSALVVLGTVPLFLAGAPQPGARGYLMAALGFTAAAVLQYRGFVYHYMAAFGFMLLFQTACLFNAKTFTAVMSGLFLLVEGWVFATGGYYWFFKQDPQQQQVSALLRELESADSFWVPAFSSFPAFPTALYTRAHYAGRSFWPIYLPLARQYAATSTNPIALDAMKRSLDQALGELAKEPDVVIVPVNKDTQRGKPFRDVLSLLSRNREFDVFWKDYVLDKTVADFQIYRRR